VRSVEPEWLDELDPGDARALRSRRDLRWLNTCMGSPAIAARSLRSLFPDHPPRRLVDLGCGDGEFLLRVAARLAREWPDVTAVLLDRQNSVPAQIPTGFQKLGWRTALVQADVFDWLQSSPPQTGDAMLANLFLHHFDGERLAMLLSVVAKRARGFVAVEPRRSAWALGVSHLVGCIGCNGVTRHDAPLSVRAGFRGDELTALWPAGQDWSLQERATGRFGHLFLARCRS
jgi:hypothetical protein